MKILIDGRVLAHNNISGVQRYAQEIVKALKKETRDIEVAIPKFKNRYYQQIWEHTLLPWYARDYDLLFCPSNIAPIYLPKKIKLIVTLHDIAFIDFSNQYSFIFRKYYQFLVPKNLKRADFVITISNFSKNRILKEFPFLTNKFKTIYHGVSSFFSTTQQKKQDYVLYVGTMNEIKNFQSILQIFLTHQFKNRYLKMILPGFATFSCESKVAKLIEQAKKSKNIEIIEKVDQNRLKQYYQNAKLFVFPSYHESFGLPVLESMACGTPVIVSKTTALSEVGGDAVVYCDPYDINDIKEKIEMVLSDENLQQEMIEKGLKRVKEFTWEKSAKEHLRVFQEVLNS